jgi:thiol-disulfide isomerase/thioredoxin
MKIVATVLLIILLGTFFYYNGVHEEAKAPHARYEIPDISELKSRPLAMDFEFVNAITSKKQKLADFEGKVVHLSFWASWCEPCQKELPFLEKLQKANPDKYLVIAVNMDTEEDGKKAGREMLQKIAPSLLPVFENTEPYQTQFNIEAIPFHYVVDKFGHTAGAFYAQLDEEPEKFKALLLQLEGEVQALH